MSDLPAAVAESRARCGLGPKVTDTSALRRVVGLLLATNEGRPHHRTGLVDSSLTTTTTIPREPRCSQYGT